MTPMLRRPSIRGLFLGCRPSAITLFVVAVVVDALNGMSGRRPRTHIQVEGAERLAPFCANPNTSAAIAVKGMLLRVLASLDHVRPCEVFRRAVHAVTNLVDRVPFAAVTPARLNIAHLQVVCGSILRLTTVTEATPFRALSLVTAWRWFQYNQSSEPLSFEVRSWWGHRQYFTLLGVN